MAEALREGAENESVYFTLITGVGGVYSCGTDLFDIDNPNTQLKDRLNATR